MMTWTIWEGRRRWPKQDSSPTPLMVIAFLVPFLLCPNDPEPKGCSSPSAGGNPLEDPLPICHSAQSPSRREVRLPLAFESYCFFNKAKEHDTIVKE